MDYAVAQRYGDAYPHELVPTFAFTLSFLALIATALLGHLGGFHFYLCMPPLPVAAQALERRSPVPHAGIVGETTYSYIVKQREKEEEDKSTTDTPQEPKIPHTDERQHKWWKRKNKVGPSAGGGASAGAEGHAGYHNSYQDLALALGSNGNGGGEDYRRYHFSSFSSSQFSNDQFAGSMSERIAAAARSACSEAMNTATTSTTEGSGAVPVSSLGLITSEPASDGNFLKASSRSDLTSAAGGDAAGAAAAGRTMPALPFATRKVESESSACSSVCSSACSSTSGVETAS